MGDFAEFEISANAVGHAHITINGQDISDQVRGFQAVSEEGEVPKVFLQHKTKGLKIQGDGIVYLQADVLPMSAILKALDPEAIDREALQRQGWGDEMSLTEHIIQIIAEQADALES